MSQELPTSALDTDLVLVQRTVAGDQRAYGLLVLKYQRRIQRLIGRMVRDVDLVEDISQETFIRAYRALHQFRGDAQFYTWLYRIAVNTAKKFLLELKHDPTVSESFLANVDDDETSWRKTNKPPMKGRNPSWQPRRSWRSSMPRWMLCQRT